MNKKPFPGLLRRVYDCDTCPAELGFSRPGPARPYYKFPPTIGATGRAKLLFVGINPRRTWNRALHDRLMRRFAVFEELARNKDGKGFYIGPDGERHYATHVAIVQRVFGRRARFEECAVATELFFCASADSKGLPESGSDCAEEYLEDVLQQVGPKVIICLGERVLGYMQAQFGGGEFRSFRLPDDSALVVTVPHPGDRSVTPEEREASIEAAVRETRTELKRRG